MALSLRRAALSLSAVAALAACSGDKSSTGNIQAGDPAALAISAGNAQSATVGQSVSNRPTVKVTDANGVGVPGVSVVFSVLSGGGSVTGATQVTGSGGTATVGSWTLGGSPGANQLQATVNGLSPVIFTATATAPASAFNIEVRFVPSAPSAEIQSAFLNAAARWQQVITGDLANIAVGSGSNGIPAGSCGHPNFPAMQNTTIDDIVIFAEVDSIDGPGKILGQAGPCFRRNSDTTTVIGYMQFDVADMQTMVGNGTIGDVVLHEMGHVLGLGTADSWTKRLSPATADTSQIRTSDIRFTGSAGFATFSAMGGSGSPPVENCAAGVPTSCGSGTWLGHWRENSFRNELMTGYISGTGNPLSRLTIAALQDLHYTVNFSAADAYTYPPAAANLSGAVAGFHLNELAPTGPLYSIDVHGATKRVR